MFGGECWKSFGNVWWRILVCTGMFWCVVENTGVWWSVCTGSGCNFWFLLVNVGVWCRMIVFTGGGGGYWRLLLNDSNFGFLFTGKCWRLLENTELLCEGLLTLYVN